MKDPEIQAIDDYFEILDEYQKLIIGYITATQLQAYGMEKNFWKRVFRPKPKNIKPKIIQDAKAQTILVFWMNEDSEEIVTPPLKLRYRRDNGVLKVTFDEKQTGESK